MAEERDSTTSFSGSLGGHEDLDLLSTMNVDRIGGGLVYFISDIHLGDGSHADVFLRKDRQFLEFLDEVEAKAQTLVIVGDALDFEQAWYFSRIVRAHREVITRLTRLTEKMRVVYVYGNHDPDIVLFRDILKWHLCDKVIVDDHILAVHGYEFDSYVGSKSEESSTLTRAVMIYERIFRTWVRIPLRDYYTFSSRLAHYLFYWIARSSRLLRWLGRRFNRPGWGADLEARVAFWTRGALGDPMGITRPAIAELETGASTFTTIVCGHSHLPGVVEVEDDKRYINLGSWSFGNSQYGIWNGRSFRLFDWITGREIRDERYRPIFEGKTDLSYEEWFKDQYLGYLRFRCGEEGLRSGVRPPPWFHTRPRSPISSHTETIETAGEVARRTVPAGVSSPDAR